MFDALSVRTSLEDTEWRWERRVEAGTSVSVDLDDFTALVDRGTRWREVEWAVESAANWKHSGLSERAVVHSARTAANNSNPSGESVDGRGDIGRRVGGLAASSEVRLEDTSESRERSGSQDGSVLRVCGDSSGDPVVWSWSLVRVLELESHGSGPW